MNKLTLKAILFIFEARGLITRLSFFNKSLHHHAVKISTMILFLPFLDAPLYTSTTLQTTYSKNRK